MSAMGRCAEGSILVDGPDDLVKEGLVVGASCGAWGCDACGPRKARRLRDRLTTALMTIYDDEVENLRVHGKPAHHAWRPFKVLTLTVDVKNFISAERCTVRDWRARPHEAAAAMKKLMRAWNRLHACLVDWWRHRSCGGARWEMASRFPFFRVVEFTKNGWPHLHVIVIWRDRFTRDELATIRRLWEKYGIGTSVKLQNRNHRWDSPARLAGYLSKYLTKACPDAVRNASFRRWSSSRGFLPAPERRHADGQAGWSRAGVSVHRLERERAGACITEMPRGFHWSMAGEPQALGPLTAAAWMALSETPAYLPPHEFVYPGASFTERLNLRAGVTIDTVGRIPTFIPDTVARGITALRVRAIFAPRRRTL
jgi:hypothetical protein